MTFFRKFFRTYFLRIIFAALIIAFLVLSPFTLFNKIYELNYSLNGEYKFDYQGVIELWNVDTFEGGSVSRAKFLEKRAIEFEKENKGIFVSVNNITLEQLKLNLENNKKPHIITFGIGAGEIIENKIISLSSGLNVREDLLKSSTVNGQIKALPIMLGGYTLISNKEIISGESLKEYLSSYEIAFSNNEKINPLMALFVNDIENVKITNKTLSSFDAYDKFINNKYSLLLGTQRDFYRCNNREENMKMQCDYYNLSGFSDLIVYGSVFKSDNKIETISKKFLEFLLTDQSQEKLMNINMFPVLYKNIYTDSKYKDYNETLLKELKTLNVFYSNETLEQIKNLLIEYYNNKTENKKEILKYLV